MRWHRTINGFFLVFLVTALGLGLANTPLEACTLLWDAPTQNTDASPLTDLAGYRAYYRTTSTAPWQQLGTDIGLVTSVVIEPCLAGDYHVVAFNQIGIVSDPSNILSTKKPKNPTNARLTR